jgi:hypothetical protein
MNIEEMLEQRKRFDRDGEEYSPSKRAERSDEILDILLDVFDPNFLAAMVEAGPEQIIVLDIQTNTTVYSIKYGRVDEVYVTNIDISYTYSEKIMYDGLLVNSGYDDIVFPPSSIGKNIFFTREAAEAYQKAKDTYQSYLCEAKSSGSIPHTLESWCEFNARQADAALKGDK